MFSRSPAGSAWRWREKTSNQNATSAVILVAILFGTYAIGYICFGHPWRPRGPGTPLRMRVYDHDWLAAAYGPAAWVESRIRGY